MSGGPARELLGAALRPWLLRGRLRDERHPPSVADAIAAIESRWPEVAADPPPDNPIVLLASGWRSGSTLLQRLVISSGEALVWGEPWNRTDTIVRLAESLRPMASGWPHHRVFADELTGEGTLHESWIANLFPPPADLIEAHRALFRTLFDMPARRDGYSRWGLKLVRLGIETVAYVRFLFPRAALVFVHRSPYDSWLSYRNARLASYARFPDKPVFGALTYGRLWAEHVGHVLAGAEQYGVLCVGYDELLHADTALRRRVEHHVGVHIDWSVLDQVVGSTRRADSAGCRMYAHERAALVATTHRIARQLGYLPPKQAIATRSARPGRRRGPPGEPEIS